MSSSLPALGGGGGGLVCESVGKADLLSDHFDGKQSSVAVVLVITTAIPGDSTNWGSPVGVATANTTTGAGLGGGRGGSGSL